MKMKEKHVIFFFYLNLEEYVLFYLFLINVCKIKFNSIPNIKIKVEIDEIKCKVIIPIPVSSQL